MNAAFYNMLHERVECNAGIHLYPITDGPYGPGEKPVVWLCIDIRKTDPVYAGGVIGNAVWAWWYNNADDPDFPSARLLFDYAVENYWDDIGDSVGGFIDDYFATVYEVGLGIIDWEYNACMRDMYDDDLFSDGELDALMREERDAVDSYDEFVNDL